MMGHHGGVVAKLKEEAPQVTEMLCCAYGLEITMKDSARSVLDGNGASWKILRVLAWITRSWKSITCEGSEACQYFWNYVDGCDTGTGF